MLFATATTLINVANANSLFVPVNIDIPSASLEVYGKAAPGALVTIYDGSAPTATVVAGVSGNFTKTLPTIDAGLHNIAVSQKDNMGIESKSISRNINIIPQQLSSLEFIVPPTINLSSADVNQGDKVKVFGFTYPSASVEIVLDNLLDFNTVFSNTLGYYEYSFSTENFYEGRHNVKSRYDGGISFSEYSKSLLYTVNIANNTNSSPAKSVNTGSPKQSIAKPLITSPPSNTQIEGNKVTISGTSAPNSQITIYVNSKIQGSVIAGADGRWVFEYYPTAEENIIYTVACNGSGCSEPSEQITLYYRIQGDIACRGQFNIDNYRYSIKEGRKVILKVKFAQKEPRTALLDWGDGTIEKYSVSADSQTYEYAHIYTKLGHYNGSLVVYKVDENCGVEKFFSVVVAKNQPLGYGMVIGLLLLLVTVLILALAWRLKDRIKALQIK